MIARESLQPAPCRGRHARIGEGELVRRTRVPEQRPEARFENGKIVVREDDHVHGIRRAIERGAAEANGREAGQMHEPDIRKRGDGRAGRPVAPDRALQPPPRVAEFPEEAHLHGGDARPRLGKLYARLLELLAERLKRILAQTSELYGQRLGKEG